MLNLSFTNQILVFFPETINLLKGKNPDFSLTDLSGVVYLMVCENLSFDEAYELNMQNLSSIEMIKTLRSKLLKEGASNRDGYYFTCIASGNFEFWYSILYNQLDKKIEELYFITSDNNEERSNHISDITDGFFGKLYEENERSKETDEELYLLTSATISYVINKAIKHNKTFSEACKYLKKNLIIKCMEKYLEISESNINEILLWQQLFD